MKLGKVQQRNRINFRDFLKKHYRNGQIYIFTITHIFEPRQFPTWRFIMKDVDSDLEISRTFQNDVAKDILKEFKFSTKRPVEKILYFKIDEQGEQEITADESRTVGYIRENWGWRLTDLIEEEEE